MLNENEELKEPVFRNVEITAEQARELMVKSEDNSFIGGFIEEDSDLAMNLEEIMRTVNNEILLQGLNGREAVSIDFNSIFEDIPAIHREISMHIVKNHLKKTGYIINNLDNVYTLSIQWGQNDSSKS